MSLREGTRVYGIVRNFTIVKRFRVRLWCDKSYLTTYIFCVKSILFKVLRSKIPRGVKELGAGIVEQ